MHIVAPNGVFTNEQMQMVTDVARKYGDGRVALTVRLTIEIQGIPYENLEPLCAEVEAAGLVTGGTGSIVRPIVACKGTVCVHGLFDTQAFAERIYDEFYRRLARRSSCRTSSRSPSAAAPTTASSPASTTSASTVSACPSMDLDKCTRLRQVRRASSAVLSTVSQGAQPAR